MALSCYGHSFVSVAAEGLAGNYFSLTPVLQLPGVAAARLYC